MKNISRFSFVILLISMFAFACNNESKEENETQTTSDEKGEDTADIQVDETEILNANFVVLETEFGTMKIKLYDETPKHKENFLKLANQGFFNDLLFHRVINSFMIQGGDPDSKNAAAGIMLGNGGPGYQIDAEFNDSLFHKKGVLAAAREGDQINPDKKSSGSQFYIVQGKIYTEEELTMMEEQASINEYITTHVEVQSQIGALQQAQDKAGFDKLIASIKTKKDFVLNKMPDFKRKAYKEIGGTPFLDNNYTVFGELVEGMDVIDKIANAKTDQNDRPLQDVKMKIKVIEE